MNLNKKEITQECIFVFQVTDLLAKLGEYYQDYSNWIDFNKLIELILSCKRRDE